MPEPLRILPPITALFGLLANWPLADNGLPPLRLMAFGLALGAPLRIVGLPADRARLFACPKEVSRVSVQ